MLKMASFSLFLAYHFFQKSQAYTVLGMLAQLHAWALICQRVNWRVCQVWGDFEENV